MKKILSSFIILWILFSSVSSLFADDSYSQHLPRVQSAIENMTRSEIKSFQEKIATTIRENDNEEIKDFLRSVLLLTAQDNTGSTQDTNSKMLPVIVQPEEIQESPAYDELTASEQRSTKYEISKLQENLKDEAQSFLSQIMSSWNSLTRYTEKWSITAEMDMKIDNLGSIQGWIDISEYIAETQVFDSSLSAKVSGFYNTSSDFTWNIDNSGESHIEVIQKWNSTYLLMKNTQFNSSHQNIEIELTPMLKKLSELAQDHTYIKFWDESWYDSYEILEYFSQESIESQLDMFFSENIMEAYGKSENGYLLKPTKHFCDIGKQLTNVFDPFNGKECSEKQYQNMIEDFMESGVEITLSTDKQTRLSISNMSDVNAFEVIDIELIWKNASFHEMIMSVTDSFDDTRYMSMHYISEDMLQVKVPQEAKGLEFMLDMDLGRNSSVKKIDVQANYEDELVFQWNYDNGLLTTSLEIDTPDIQASCSFDWNAYKSYLQIDGRCDISSYLVGTDSNELTIESSLEYNWVDGRNDLDWKFEAISDEDNYLSFGMTSEAKRRSSWIYEIQAPASTINYIDFLKEISPEDSYYYDDYEYETDYEYEYNTYDEYEEACYIYDSGDITCYEYHNDKTISCEFSIESGEEVCETYDYGYTIEEASFDEYDRVCYNYDSWDRTCYDYYDDKDITCTYLIETDTETCETYEYEDYYYDDEYYDEDIEDAEDAMEQ